RNDDQRPEIDDVLRDYFQAEMPHPWPAFRQPLTLRRSAPASFWSRSSGRFALAASIILLVASYIGLGGFFTRPAVGNQNVPEMGGGLEPKERKSRTPAPKMEIPQ